MKFLRITLFLCALLATVSSFAAGQKSSSTACREETVRISILETSRTQIETTLSQHVAQLSLRLSQTERDRDILMKRVQELEREKEAQPAEKKETPDANTGMSTLRQDGWPGDSKSSSGEASSSP